MLPCLTFGMARRPTDAVEKPREWRRCVLIPTRMRSSAGWGDARILNVSSRGMMVHTPHSVDIGSIIELRRGTQTFVAKVVWKDGSRAGLKSDIVLPLTDILCMSEPAEAHEEPERFAASTVRAMDVDGAFYRAKGRLIELTIMTMIACSIAVATTSILGGVVTSQLKKVEAALGS